MKVIPKLQQGNTIESDNTKVVRPEIHEPIKAKYIFDENPVVKRMFFNKATSNIKPISRNEARRGFSHGDRYEQLYPGIYNRRYEMSAVVPSGRPLKFQEASEFTEYAGKNPIGKIIGKEAEPVMRMGDKEFMTFRQPGTDYIGPIDDVAGHLVKFQMNKGKLRQTSQDMWKFNPADYAKRWNDSPNTANQVRLIKQAALMDKVGRPFILQQSNPIWIEGKSVRNPELVTMAHGGRFDFKKSPLLKKQEEINGKRDMRKKFIKSSRPTYKKRIKKAQQGMRFVSYNPVSNPTIDYTDITNPINPFSEYNYNTTYDKPEALVVPVRDTEETDVVANNPTVEPVINKPVASKPVTDKPVTANSTWKSPYTNRKQWSTELINAYKKAGITNDNAIRMLLAQDALESSWGKSAQGKYNFGNLTTGSSWKGDYVTGNDKNAKGEAIKQKFRSYNSMDEYAADKIQFLKRLYDFDENDDINKFVAKLTGSNKGKRRYAEATNYAKVLTGVYNGIPKGENGMIIKYQNPPHGIARRDATYVAPKMYAPRPYKTKEEEIIEQNRNSEMISIPAHSTIGMVDGKLQVIDTPARQITNVGAGYLSGTDPVGEFVVGNVAAGKPLMWLGKGVKYGAARVFKKGAKPKVDAYYPSKVYKRTVDDVNRDYLNFIEYIDNPETMQKLADIDKELGTQYVKAVTDFKEAAKQGKLRVKSPKPGTLDIQGYPIRNPQTLTHPDIMKNPSYDYIDIDILADFPPNSVGHEFKHAIENYQAALSGIKGSVDDALFANPRLQALMKDNIVSEDEFVASMVKRYPKNDIKEIRKVYKYLTDPGEFNAQLHPLIELEQRAGKSGLPNFKDADAVNQVIKQGRASGHGGSHLDILFNNLLKPDKREEFVKQFNKYGWSLAAPAIINNRE